MKKNIKRFFLFGIILTTVYISCSFFLYRDYFKADKNSLFFYIPIILGTYSSESNNENNSYTKDDFYSFINSYYADSLFIAAFPTIKFLNRHKDNIRFGFHPDSNYFVLYDIGIDGTDDSLKGKVFEKIYFYYPILRPKGDILLGYIMPHNDCDYRSGLNWYFKNGQRIAVENMDKIINDNVYPEVVFSLQKESVEVDSISFLISSRYSETGRIWHSKLLCNWSQTSPLLSKFILDNFESSLSKNKVDINADSIIYNFRYLNTSIGNVLVNNPD